MLFDIPEELIKDKREDGCICLNNHLCTLQKPENCTRNFLKFKVDEVKVGVKGDNA